MVWQAGKVDFIEFFQFSSLSLVNWLIPGTTMSIFVKQSMAEGKTNEGGAYGGVFVLGITKTFRTASGRYMITGIGGTGVLFPIMNTSIGRYYTTFPEHREY